MTGRLMERIADHANLRQAYKRVKANKGLPGVDSMTVAELGKHLAEHWAEVAQSLRDGSYQPQPVRGADSGSFFRAPPQYVYVPIE